MELDELSGRTTGRLGYIGPTMLQMLREYVGRTTSRTTGRARVALQTTLQIELRSDALRTNNRCCATAPLDRQTYNAGYTHMEIEAQCPWRAGSNDPDLRCRGSDEVC